MFFLQARRRHSGVSLRMTEMHGDAREKIECYAMLPVELLFQEESR